MFAEVSPFVQAARQDAERTPLGQGPNRNWTSNARPGLAQGQGGPQRTLTDARDGEGQSPSARAVGQMGEPREPDVGGRTSGGVDLWCYLPKESGSFQSHSPSRAAAAKPRRGRSPRVLRGEAVLFRRRYLAKQRRYPTPHPNPLPQGERGRLPRTITLR